MMEFWLRRLYCTATAAVDVLGGGDAGGGGGSSVSDGVGTGDAGTGIPDGGGDSSQLTDATADGIQQPDTTQAAADTNTDPLGQDGRLIPQKYRELFKQDKDLKNLWFSHQAFRKEVPGGLNEVRQLKEFHQTVGGPEGLQQLQSVATELENIDAQLASGDPKLIGQVAQNPEAFNKLITSGIEHWAKTSPEDYQHVMARVMVNTFNGGPVNILNQLQQALSAKNFEQASQLFDKFADWYQGIESIAAKQPERKIDPQVEKFNQEKTAWEQQKTKDFQAAVGNDVKTHYNSGFKSELAKEFKARNLDLASLEKSDPESFGIMMSQCDQMLGRTLQADAAFIKQYSAMLKTMDRGKAVQFAKAKIDSVLPGVVQKVYKAFNRLGGGPKPVQQPQQAATTQQAQVVRGTKAPAQDQIDWSRSKPGDVLDGKAFLKGRKEQYVWEA
jgi:hypothetical protein